MSALTDNRTNQQRAAGKYRGALFVLLLGFVVSQAFFQCPHGICQDLSLLMGTVCQQRGGFLVKRRVCGIQTVAEKGIHRGTQGVGDVDDGRKAQLCGTPFNMGDVRGLLEGSLCQDLLRQTVSFAKTPDAYPNGLIIQFQNTHPTEKYKLYCISDSDMLK